MVTNFIGPNVITIDYTIGGFKHLMNLNCEVLPGPVSGSPFSTIDLATKDASTVDAQTAIEGFVNAIKPIFHTGAIFGEAILYSVPFGTTIKNFISSHSLTGFAGTAAGSGNLANQSTFTFRSQEGGILKIVALETVSTDRTRVPLATQTGVIGTFRDYVIATDTWLLARDTSYPISAIGYANGGNERLFKKRYRS